MILVITPETIVPSESKIINQMFYDGLDLLHIRKPWISREEMAGFISSIHEQFYGQLVLHSHYDLGQDYGVSRFHFREEDRKNGKYKPFMNRDIISTSVHEITAYNTLEKEWEYAFISPFFPSISKKGYGIDSTVMESLKQRNNPDVKLIGLGGIDSSRIHEVFELGVDGVALLGAIWENDEPLNVFRKCKKNVPL
ncbi:thiamine phosphate synthase [Chryseobacterium contaminans]|uniref:Thiamine phosphate synthase n=1 Tax=Chryseobacterium contaminans TaxID=1423959 RepID=A0A1M7HHH4_9FLAO|nr:thiamine phosphate synthase [Chryseobacterium contaminans]OCA78527.1 thiamine phosphate synthase [Chryseobacterium contaminans]SHM27773.1 thiamine-phosphate pyrophosphorylase [Chryseobacterium contaminans]